MIQSDMPSLGIPRSPGYAAIHPVFKARAEAIYPNALVRWSFYLSIFSIPFIYVYLPGTGEHVGVTRLVQLFMLCAVLSQPQVCLRLVPTTLLWFSAYIVLTVVWGYWLTPDTIDRWWPRSREFIEYLPWLWVMFNVLQFPETRRPGLWALGLGCGLAAAFHVAGIGVASLENGFEGRTTLFGMNANDLGATYATGMIALLGLWMLQHRTRAQRYLALPLIVVIGVAMAKTGSRSAIAIVLMGVLVLCFLGRSFASKTKRFGSIAVFAAIVGVILWQVPTAIQRFGELNTHNVGEHNPRARMIPVLWNMFLQSPVIGHGPNNYEYKLTREALPYLMDQGKLIDSHNLALLLLVETGIIGFLLYALGLRPALVSAWKSRLKPGGLLPLALLLPTVAAGLTISNPIQQMAFWVAIAYGLVGTV